MFFKHCLIVRLGLNAAKQRNVVGKSKGFQTIFHHLVNFKTLFGKHFSLVSKHKTFLTNIVANATKLSSLEGKSKIYI